MNDPDVVLTDLGLAILGAYLGWRLWRAAAPGAAIIGGLASAALFGAIFHAFFPAGTETAAGFTAWLPVALSIVVVAAALLDLSLPALVPRLAPRLRRGVVVAYGVLFAAVVLLVDESFATIVRFYAPALVLSLVAAALQALRTSGRDWSLVTAGLAVAIGAALLQQARVAIDPDYFDHNALYHVIQGAAVVLLYLGFHERRPDPVARAR